MAIYNTQVTVSSTAQVIVNLDNVTQYVTLHSKGNTFLGGSSGVTTSNGLHLENGDTLSLTIPEGCQLWAVSTSEHTLAVLTARVD